MTMIRYPLYVTLDTNIFVSNKFDFGQDSTLGLLVKYVETGKINVVLSNIVISEVEKHITDEGDKICGSVRKLRTDILKTTSEEYIKQIGLDILLQILNKQEIQKKSRAEWEGYLQKINPEIMDNAKIDLDRIISDYFSFNPPFEHNDKKRKEFPDAFIANQIRERFGSDKQVAIVSSDKGFMRACGSTGNHLFYDSLGDLYDAMNREEIAYQDAVKIVASFMSGYIEKINARIEDNECVEVHGLAYDKDGIADGYDYTETIVTSVSDTSCRIRTIDEITETTVRASLLFTSKIEVECFYEDYENAAWDSETESYLFLETKEILEKHTARFLCGVEVHRDGSALRIFPFKVILNGDSLNERIEDMTTEYDYERDIMNRDREEVGLCSLDHYEDYLEENLEESDFNSSIISLFDEINSLYGEYEEIAAVYENLVQVLDSQDAKRFIKILSSKSDQKIAFPYPADLDQITDEEADEAFLWAEEKLDRVFELSEKAKLPDTIRYGQVIEIFENDELYRLEMSQLFINPSEGDEEEIPIDMKDKMGNVVAKGYIKLIVGFMHFDEDGGVGDALEDSIEYQCGDVIAKVENIMENIRSGLREEQIIAKSFENILSQYEL